MTITSAVPPSVPPSVPAVTAATPTVPGVPRLAAPGGTAAATGFAALVAQLLTGTSTGAAAGPGPCAATDPQPATGEADTEEDVAATEEAVPSADVLAPAALPPTVLPAARAVGGDGLAGPAGPATAAVAGLAADGPAGGPAGGPVAVGAGAGDAPAPTLDAPAATSAGRPAGEPPAAPGGPTGPPTGPEVAAQPAGQAPTTPVAVASAAAQAALPAVPVATSSAAAPPAAPVAHAPVMAQVVPEVTRLVSRGNGVHRLTMRLQPEALGEVRVTLTVRDGGVQVHLSGGEDAARALAEGAPELRRVLELAGAEARVVVRDLTGQQSTPLPQPSAGGADQDASYDARGSDTSSPDTPGGNDGQQGHHARTRGGAGATDGLPDGAVPLRPDPVSGARQGIDLTM